MKCPVCNIDLLMSERSGVEIDYCPQCRGIWLDRGELDKIIEKAAIVSAPVAAPSDRYEYKQQESYRLQPQSEHGKHEDEYYGNKKRKKESFLGDLFDF